MIGGIINLVTKTEAIKNFLLQSTHKDLANLYNFGMECQVNVARDGGERVEGEYKGRKYNGWTDGLVTWKTFRIPWNSNTVPEFEDSPLKFDLAMHAEAIGLSGWDWQNRKSRWVAFDFDSIATHSNGLSSNDLDSVKKAACDIEWVTVRQSTSGTGIHLYVFLDPVTTENHCEHAALARSILGMMSALTGFDFDSKIDICGGNMWVYHRKMKGTTGLTLLKQGSILTDIPLNWRDHVKVITGHNKKSLPQDIGNVDTFEELAGQRVRVPLDEEHKGLISYLKDSNLLWWWDQDHNMLVTHTHFLEQAHRDLNCRGFFKTISKGTDLQTQNCFCFPIRRGSWTVYRYGKGIQEHESWQQNKGGWTTCYFNRVPDFDAACRTFGGLEDPSGGYVFREAEIALKAASLVGVNTAIAPILNGRKTKIKEHKDGRLVIEIERDSQDRADEMSGWLPNKKDKWVRIFNTLASEPEEPDIGSYDDLIRHPVTPSGEDSGWVVRADDCWREEPLAHVKLALTSLGLSTKEVTDILGSSIFKCWTIVNIPFESEYPGNRRWNRDAAQLRYVPNKENPKYESWWKVIQHCGKGLDEAVKENGWCKINGIATGADYLKCWIASLFQEPMQPLPYLFFYGPQNSGKSIFHEALGLLLTKGYKRSDAALRSQAGHNAEIEGAILCVTEEIDLNKNEDAYNRIKDWVTSRELLIHPKYVTPYQVPNTTHWIQCSNDRSACPIFSGDTRITMCYVDSLDPTEQIPKRQLIGLLEREAPDFLGEIFNLELPPSNDRLNIPPLETEDKTLASKMRQSPLEAFIEEQCKSVNGCVIKFGDFYNAYMLWCSENNIEVWSKIRVGKELPSQYPKGRIRSTGQHYIGNVWWLDREYEPYLETNFINGQRIILRGEYLDQ